MRKTLKFRHISTAQFEEFFMLDSPGYFIARDAMNAGETATAADAVEVLCLANQLYESELLNPLVVELAPLGWKSTSRNAAPTQAGISSPKSWATRRRCASSRTLRTKLSARARSAPARMTK
jgi:hypothetical protein